MHTGARHKAFTLIELLIVVCIIAILLVLMMPTLRNFTTRVNNTACQRHLETIHRIFQAYTEKNAGFYPICEPYYGWYFNNGSGETIDPLNPWKKLRQVVQLKELGAKAEYFFCPMDPHFQDADSAYWKSWETPRVPPNWSGGGGLCADTSYVMLQYRWAWWDSKTAKFNLKFSTFTDGRRTPFSNAQEDDNLPLVADMMHFRNIGFMHGWLHGGGVDSVEAPGLYNASCNTLFTNGRVEFREWSDLEAQGPALMGSIDYYWFWLGKEVAERDE